MEKRRSFLQKSVVALASSLGLLSSTQPVAAPKPKKVKGAFVHTIYIWLKEPENTLARAKFMNAMNDFLPNMPMVRRMHIGTPAETDRPIIDNSYTFCVIVTFDSKKEHDLYQEHPLHKKFLGVASELWERILIYDSVMR